MVSGRGAVAQEVPSEAALGTKQRVQCRSCVGPKKVTVCEGAVAAARGVCGGWKLQREHRESCRTA